MKTVEFMEEYLELCLKYQVSFFPQIDLQGWAMVELPHPEGFETWLIEAIERAREYKLMDEEEAHDKHP